MGYVVLAVDDSNIVRKTKQADLLLYGAKEGGRNQVIVER